MNTKHFSNKADNPFNTDEGRKNMIVAVNIFRTYSVNHKCSYFNLR